MSLKIELYNTEDINSKDFKRLVKSLDMASVLFEIHYNLRKKVELKVDEKEYTVITLDIVFEEINELMNEHNINIDDII